jgi:acetylglutamate kinase
MEDLAWLQREGRRVVVVHGGGKVISQWMEKQGTIPKFIRGNRVTDGPSLEIATAVLTGLVNKQLVASLTKLGVKAVGLSGVDGGLLECKIADAELGFVGEVVKVDPCVVEKSLEAGFLPMIAPIGLHANDGSKNAGCLLNINGDTVTGDIAKALGASKLIFLTDVPGVMDAEGRVVPRMGGRQAQIFIGSGIAKGGMIPKLEACLKAMPEVSEADIIDGRQPGALRRCVEGEALGTRVRG